MLYVFHALGVLDYISQIKIVIGGNENYEYIYG